LVMISARHKPEKVFYFNLVSPLGLEPRTP
jgi:hypothetical protein